eukprot:763456-Hanusia_phi.AAC.8
MLHKTSIAKLTLSLHLKLSCCHHLIRPYTSFYCPFSPAAAMDLFPQSPCGSSMSGRIAIFEPGQCPSSPLTILTRTNRSPTGPGHGPPGCFGAAPGAGHPARLHFK